jgi:hypothetical protein
MGFFQDDRLSQLTGFGDYVTSFESDHGQVRVDIYRLGGDVVAYVSRPYGVSPEDVTDPWLAPVKEKAKEVGARDQVRLIYESAAPIP